MQKPILNFIDFFHTPFSRWIPKATFRYLVTGSTTAGMGVLVYFLVYNFLLCKQGIALPFLFISGPIAALIIELCITFPMGFLLNKYLVFTNSDLKGRIQLFRYGTVVAINILLNYILIKLMVEAAHIYPTVAKFFTTVIIAVFSYFTQKNYSFGNKVSTKA
ncbi:MAG: GtrA family protein [Sphingobacteriaceae bacterium]